MASNPTVEVIGEEGLTFSKIGRYIKKAFPITLIVMLCCVLIFTAIYAFVLLDNQKKTRYAATQLSFTAKSISEGRDPNGKSFDFQSLRSLPYVTDALTETGLEVDATEVYNNLTVIPVLEASVIAKAKNSSTAALSGGTVIIDGVVYYPTRFQISFAYPKIDSVKISQDQASAFLNNLVKAYRERYIQDYLVAQPLAVSFAMTSPTQEFSDYFTMVDLLMGQVETYLSQQEKDYAGLKSPEYQMTVSQLRSQFNVLKYRVSELDSRVISNSIARNVDTLKKSLEASKKNYEARMNTLKDTEGKGLIADVQQQLKDFQLPTISTTIDQNGNKVEQKGESEEYNALQRRLTELLDEYATLRSAVARIEDRIAAFGAGSVSSDAATIAAMDQSIETLSGDMAEFIRLTNNVVSDLRKTDLDASIRQTLAAATYSDNPSVTKILMTYVIVLIISFFLGLIAHAIYRSVMKHRALAAGQEEKEEGEAETALEQSEIQADAVTADEQDAPKEDGSRTSDEQSKE